MDTLTLAGKEYAYNSETKFIVEVGRYKGKYSPRYTFVGNVNMATFYYSCVNVGLGYKKRFVIQNGDERKVVARCIS